MIRVYVKRSILKFLSLLHLGISTRIINVLQQSIGFGFDSGLKNEVNQFLKELNNFKIINPIILDVGANVGNWSKLVNSELMSCEIHAFEPSRETFLALAEFAKSVSNVYIHNFACGEKNTSRNLYYNESKSGMASLSKRNLKHLNINFEKFESVEIRRLDTFLSDLSIEPDALKIDAEGHELEVLKGLGDHIYRLKVIQFEFGGTDIDSRIFFHDFWSFFETKEFDLYRLSPRGKIRVSSFQERDEVFSFTTYFAIARKTEAP